MPKAVTEFIDTASEAAEFYMAKLGTVTHAANHFKVATVLGDGSTTHNFVRDSAAMLPRQKNTKTFAKGMPPILQAVTSRPVHQHQTPTYQSTSLQVRQTTIGLRGSGLPTRKPSMNFVSWSTGCPTVRTRRQRLHQLGRHRRSLPSFAIGWLRGKQPTTEDPG